MKTTEVKARAAIAMLREGLKDSTSTRRKGIDRVAQNRCSRTKPGRGTIQHRSIPQAHLS
jgi:hypothetical protein